MLLYRADSCHSIGKVGVFIIFFIIIFIIFRYCAVCHPFSYRDAVRATSVNYRVAKYVIPVVVFAIILNIPKFFETEIFYIPVNKTGLDEPANANDTVSYILTYDVTELRKDKDYIRYEYYFTFGILLL